MPLNGKGHAIPWVGEDRDALAKWMRRHIREQCIYGVVHVGEAWVRHAETGPNDHTLKQVIDGEIRVSELRPEDRREVLTVTAHTRDGYSHAWVEEIRRVGGGVQFGECRQFDDLEGRFIECAHQILMLSEGAPRPRLRGCASGTFPSRVSRLPATTRSREVSPRAHRNRLVVLSNNLYSLGVNTLGMLLRSTSRTEILRALACQPGAVGLRQVARIAGVHPHSAELALATLVREELVKRQGTPSRPLYALNRRHADSAILAAVFSAATQALIEARSRTLPPRARSLLPFIRETTRMLTHARRSRHVA